MITTWMLILALQGRPMPLVVENIASESACLDLWDSIEGREPGNFWRTGSYGAAQAKLVCHKVVRLAPPGK